MKETPTQPLASRLEGKRVLVVGDAMLDEYVWGDVRRISPEAPVPVVEVDHEDSVPGGAANTAAGVVALGGEAQLCAVVGDDVAAARLRSTIAAHGISPDGLLEVHGRPTTTKRRIIAASQQVVRADHESRAALGPEAESRISEWAGQQLPSADAVVISDYAKGVVSQSLSASLIDLASSHRLPVVVDPKGLDYSKYRGATVVTPNLHEVEQATHCQITDEHELANAASSLIKLLDGAAVLVTRGAAGMTLFDPGNDRWNVHVPANARNVFDVTGAGDTVVATLAMALANGATLSEAAELATAAAGVVVAKVGTSTVTPDEIARLGLPN